MRYFSMFTGVGGFELGIGDKGEGVGFSEIDKYANQLLQNKWPNVRNFGDATKIKASELPSFDFLCGGFPCQAFSIAGRRRGFQDTRGTLFFEIGRILEAKRPKIILLENVKGLLNHDKGQTFKVIIQTLSELGYDVQWMVLNSKFFGVPQNRERVFIIGSLRGTSRPEILPFTESDKSSHERIYARTETSMAITSRYYKGGAGTMILAQPLKFLERNQRNLQGKYSFTVDSVNTGGIRDGTKIRRLTPLECERLQGFPDNWTEGFSDTQRYKMMGNAVTVNVIRVIVEKITYPEHSATPPPRETIPISSTNREKPNQESTQ